MLNSITFLLASIVCTGYSVPSTKPDNAVHCHHEDVPSGFLQRKTVVPSGIFFNLPNKMYCGSCDLRTVQDYVSPVDKEDTACKLYTTWRDSGWSYKSSFKAMFKQMRTEGSTRAWIFEAAWRAKIAYENFFEAKKTYSYRIFVLKALDPMESCLNIFTEGEGFRTVSVADKLKKEKIGLWSIGQEYEDLFLQATRNEWAQECLSYNDVAYNDHSLFVEQCKNHQSRLHQQFLSMPETPPYEILDLAEQINHLPTCPANCDYDNHRLILSSQSCNQIYCFGRSEADEVVAVPSDNNPPENRSPSIDEGAIVDTEDSRTVLFEGKKEGPAIIHEIAPSLNDALGHEFIEIRSSLSKPSKGVYTGGESLKGIKLAMFTAGSKLLFFVANLNNEKFNEKGFFAIDSDRLDLPYIHKAKEPTEVNFRFLPDGDEEPVVILLMFRYFGDKTIPIEHWNLIGLSGRKGKAKIDLNIPRVLKKGTPQEHSVDLLSIMSKSTIDAHVIGTRRSNIFPYLAKFSPTFVGCDFILPLQNDLYYRPSLSFCNPTGELIPYKSQFFQQTSRTLMLENACNANHNFVLEELEHVPEEDGILVSVGETSRPTSSHECPTTVNNPHAYLFDQIDEEVNRIRNEYNDKYEFPFFPPSKFNNELKEKLLHPNVIIDEIDLGTQIGSYEIVRNDAVLNTKAIRCSVCYDRLRRSKHTVPENKIDSLCKEGGYYISSRKRMNDRLREHLGKKYHFESLLLKVRSERQMYMVDRNQKYIHTMSHDNNVNAEGFEKLENHFKAVYTLVRMNTAIQNFPKLMQLMDKTGSDVGPYLRSQYSASRMVEFLADESKSIMIKYLISRKVPFSLILDGSSDFSNNHVVLVYFQVQEGARTVVLFFKTLTLGKSSTSASYLESIQKSVSEEGVDFESYFKQQITAVITDGENTMLLLQRLVNSWVNKKTDTGNSITLFSVNCLAHKVQLISRGSLVPGKRDTDLGEANCLTYFLVFENKLNHLHSFIKGASRRLGEWREAIEKYRLPRTELVKLFPNRWVSSEDKTLNNLIKGYKTLMYTMQAIRDDRVNYKTAVRNEAQSLLDTVLDKRFLIIPIYLKDYTFAFKIWSKKIQQTGALFVDQYEPAMTLMEQLTKIELFEGEYLQSFLKSCRCIGLVYEKCSSIQDYSESNSVIWNGIEFRSHSDNIPPIEDINQALIKKSKERFSDYLPLDKLKLFRVFRPSFFLASIESLAKQPDIETTLEDEQLKCFACSEISQLADIFGFNPQRLVIDWSRLTTSIVLSKNFSAYRTYLKTSQFWGILRYDVQLAWTEDLVTFLKTIMTISAGSVPCESGFSKYGTIKNKLRSRLSVKTVESLLRILLHGPENIDDFDTFKFSKLWVSGGRFTPVMKPNTIVGDLEKEEISDIVDEGVDTNEDSEVFETLSIDDDERTTKESEEVDMGNRLLPRTMLFK